MKQISRRTMLGTAAAMVAAPAFADGCPVGPPQHHKGPLVFMDYDQLELDASYDQVYYEPLIAQVSQRLNSNSDAMRSRVGAPQRALYGPTGIEQLDIYRTGRPNAPVFVFIHGGNWLVGSAKQYGYPARDVQCRGARCGVGIYWRQRSRRGPRNDGGSSTARHRLGLQERLELRW
jgi:arylformamidase